MNNSPKICLILDNPLRDLDGLVLVAWHLAKMGAEVWLVPMYNQAFDVRAIGADFILMNYVRTNNKQHVLSYMREGIKVGVLDTEGMAGKSPDEFSEIITKSGCANLMDIYCVWGKGQYEAINRKGIVSEEVLRLTGCPRYDYCSYPWRNSLMRPNIEHEYVLINTNFPGINPRFVRSRDDEIKAIVSGGFSLSAAEEYMRDGSQTHKEMIELITNMVLRFPEQHFVLRPHPFESTSSYEQAIKAKNFEVRQEGTAIEWLNHARVLIQLNCLTAIEAAAFGVPSLTPSWLKKPILTVPLSNQLSINFSSEEELMQYLESELEQPEQAGKPLQGNKENIIDEFLLADGSAAQRTAKAIMDELATPTKSKNLPVAPLKFKILNSLRLALGYSLSSYLQDTLQDKALKVRKSSKLFNKDQIEDIAKRIENCVGESGKIKISDMSSAKLAIPRLASGNSICISYV